jgi:hypothetical protein
LRRQQLDVTLQYFDDCPNYKITDARLRRIITDHRLDTTIAYQLIDTPEAAETHQFRGSPTVLINGVDPFADTDAPVGLACRVYQTELGPAGSPTLNQLEQVIAAAKEKA